MWAAASVVASRALGWIWPEASRDRAVGLGLGAVGLLLLLAGPVLAGLGHAGLRGRVLGELVGLALGLLGGGLLGRGGLLLGDVGGVLLLGGG